MLTRSLRLTKVEANVAPDPDISCSYQSIHFQQVDTTASISMSVDTPTRIDLTEKIAVSNPMFQHDTDQVEHWDSTFYSGNELTLLLTICR